tara:strand:- start:264 stop:1646 length:1383 start_codon:yes stop_codon:yes gene_type:complete
MILKIFSYLPIFLQNFIISFYGFYWYRRRYSGVFKKNLIKFKNREKFTSQQWYKYQEKEFRKLLVHAFTNVPFYKKKYTKAGITAKKLEKFNLKDLNTLPILTKQELRRFGTTTLLSNKIDKKGTFFSSSGSTGTPTKIYFSRKFHQKWSAVFEARIRNWAGVTYKSPRATIGGRRVLPRSNQNAPFHRYNFIEKQIYFSAYHLSINTIDDYINAIRKYKIKYLTGYAKSIYLLSFLARKKNIPVPKLNVVITSSEKLTNEMRNLIGEVFDCNVFDSYSGVEACGLFSEFKSGELLDNPDVGITEIVDEDFNPVQEGGKGQIISTGLLNFDQPLIRYMIGDLATLKSNNSENININMKVIKSVDGRREDIIQGPDGRLMVRFHSLFIDILGLVNSQIIQETKTDFIFKLVVDKTYNISQEKIISKRMYSQIGRVNISFCYVESIKVSKNGKYKSIISKVK